MHWGEIGRNLNCFVINPFSQSLHFTLNLLIPEMKWQCPEDIQSGLVAHLLVPLSAETVAVRILPYTAASQKNLGHSCSSLLPSHKDGDNHSVEKMGSCNCKVDA